MSQPKQELSCGPAALLAVCGWSGSGKTTLLESMIPGLVQAGLRVAVIKHCGHEPEIDRSGKDSDRLFRAGADVTLQTPSGTVARRRSDPADEIDILAAQLSANHDLVLVEGHKSTTLPKVWLAHPDDSNTPADIGHVLAVLPCTDDRPRLLRGLIEQELRTAFARRPLHAGILIGGRSTRMGRDKALLAAGKTTFLERTIRLVQPHAAQVGLLGHGPTPPVDPRPIEIPDSPALEGPLAGVLAALRWAPCAAWIILACDLACLEARALEWLIGQRAPGRWAVLPIVESGRIEPLLAVYEPQARSVLERLAARGVTSLQALAGEPAFHTPAVPPELRRSWTNVNTPADLDRLGNAEA